MEKGSELFTEGGEAKGGGEDWRRSELDNGRRVLVKGKTVERCMKYSQKKTSLALKDHRRKKRAQKRFCDDSRVLVLPTFWGI